MVRIEVSTEIKRPVAEVFSYATDPSKVPEWNAIVQENSATDTPIRVGTRVTTRARFLGRRVDSVNEVTELVQNQKFVQKTDKPFPLTLTNLFSAAPGGTKLTTILEGEPGGFFKIGEPILVRIAKKQFQAQLDTMKELLEAPTPAEVR